jgi:hypothetical protein
MAASKYCKVCGRDRHDPEEHDVVRIPTPAGEVRRRRCKNLVIVAEHAARDLVTGERRVIKRYVPERQLEIDGETTTVPDPQRTQANQARWVHRDTLKAQDRQEALRA